MLPAIPQPDPELPDRLAALGVTPQFVRGLVDGPDTLLSPLQLSREGQLSDDPGIVAVRETFCRTDFHVRFVRDLIIFSDYLRSSDENAVMGAGQTTAVLYNAALPAANVPSLLDLGCGAGSLALLLARKAGLVVATDLNERAVRLTRFNAIQNGIANIEALSGDLFSPVSGRTFDLIVSQPPYYPGTGSVFLHGGIAGSELTMTLLREIRCYLTRQGQAFIHTSLPVASETPQIRSLHTTEYTPGFGEIEGTRHSLLLLRAGEGSTRIDVDPREWGRP